MELKREYVEPEAEPTDDAVVRTWFGNIIQFWEKDSFGDTWFCIASSSATGGWADWKELSKVDHRVYYPTDREDGEDSNS